VITDSGGIQEEATYLKIPCLTVRPSTERPITIWEGSNQLVLGSEIFEKAKAALNIPHAEYKIPKYWEGNTAPRILKLLENYSRGLD